MRVLAAAALVAVLTACQVPQSYYERPTGRETWTDTFAQGRGTADLTQDGAACEWEMERIRLANGPVGWGVWRRCMAGRGWREVMR